jgi:3-methyl-2-oxobutanoate hydroxymethyltransferase
MGHIGLTPQTATQLEGFKVQGKDPESIQKLIKDAQSLEKAGAFSLLLEAIPRQVAQTISENINIPTIGSSFLNATYFSI